MSKLDEQAIEALGDMRSTINERMWKTVHTMSLLYDIYSKVCGDRTKNPFSSDIGRVLEEGMMFCEKMLNEEIELANEGMEVANQIREMQSNE